MHISVDPKSSVPIYVQLKDQIRLAIATGALQGGDQLPTVRELGSRLRVNPNTIARVYRELQAEGLFSSRQGSGTFVSENALSAGMEEARLVVLQRLRDAAAMGLSLKIDPQELARLFQEALAQAVDSTKSGQGVDTHE